MFMKLIAALHIVIYLSIFVDGKQQTSVAAKGQIPFQVLSFKVGLGLTCKHQTGMERPVRDKHYSLLGSLIDKGCERLKTLGPWDANMLQGQVYIGNWLKSKLGSWPCLQTLVWAGKVCLGKHSTWLVTKMFFGQKKFYNNGHWALQVVQKFRGRNFNRV